MGTYTPSPPGANTDDATVLSFIAGEAINERDLVEFGTTQGYVIACDSANAADAAGICLETTASGSMARIAMLGCGGSVEVVAEDGNVAVGGIMKSGTTTNDRVITISTDGTTAQRCVGTALKASQTAGDVVVMLLNCAPGLKIYPALS